MKTKRSFLPLRLAVATVLTLFFVFSLATNAENSPVSIESKNVSTIQTDIQNAINSAESGGIVTVTGSKTGADATLNLSIPEGVTVLWQAEYADNGLFTSGLISLSGAGTFEVGAGGSISSSSSRSSNSINIYSQSNNITITVSDAGKVQTTGDCAIYTTGSISITGGEVSATSGTAIIP
ncbi:MAG: hypothetical protein LBK23_05085, partial [Oscillospiraceae bacterium]|nr:hypothetical protein [Oscillospiraceae bacterium]